MKPEFEGFGKIPRMSKGLQMVVTEKLDGTNAQINIYPDENGELQLQAGSRKRWIKPTDDNFGFATWCEENKEELIAVLGEGRHFGEWCGPGIQKNIYDLDKKELYLFNVARWGMASSYNPLPDILNVVPLLYDGTFDTRVIEGIMDDLLSEGSELNSCTEPEGIIIYLPKIRQIFKTTFKYAEGKWGKE